MGGEGYRDVKIIGGTTGGTPIDVAIVGGTTVTLNVGDIEIGSVEIKNATTDDRMVVNADGTTNSRIAGVSVTINTNMAASSITLNTLVVNQTLTVVGTIIGTDNVSIVSCTPTLPVDVITIPTVTIGNSLVISQIPNITITVSDCLVTLNTNLAASSITLNTTIISLPTITVGEIVMPSITIASIIMPTISIGNSLTVDSVPTITIGSMPSITGLVTATIVSLPAITGEVTATIASAVTTQLSGALTEWGLTTIITPAGGKGIRLAYIRYQNPAETAVDVFVIGDVALASVTLYPSSLAQYGEYEHDLSVGNRYIDFDADSVLQISCTPTVTLNWTTEYTEV